MTEYLTYREAATRTRRSIRSIKRWRRAGMPMGFDDRGRRVVEELALLAWWRARMTADPVHQQRLRALQPMNPALPSHRASKRPDSNVDQR